MFDQNAQKQFNNEQAYRQKFQKFDQDLMRKQELYSNQIENPKLA